MNRKLTTEAQRTQRSQVLSVGEIPTDKTMSLLEKNFQIERRESFRRNFILHFFRQIFSFAPVDSTGANENFFSVPSVPLW